MAQLNTSSLSFAAYAGGVRVSGWYRGDQSIPVTEGCLGADELRVRDVHGNPIAEVPIVRGLVVGDSLSLPPAGPWTVG